ncbi:MAG: hypothetical protein M4579_004336 [Chaenotheca gracillima]|nr:MAG: hypothetical protein M4579_004336 [Chaenotheca gracillima]
MPPWILTTPSSRGLGYALTRRLLRTTNLPIVATARQDPEKIKEALLKDVGLSGAEGEKRLDVLKVDVTDESTISSAASFCRSKFTSPSHLHLAFILPGILRPEKHPRALSQEAMTSTFAINTIGPLLMMKHFSDFLPSKRSQLPLISESESDSTEDGERWTPPPFATWVTMSARVGSTTENRLGGWYSYRASKAAVNSMTKTFDLQLQNSASGNRAMAISMHPGTVKTGLSKEFWGSVPDKKLFEPDYSASQLLNVIEGFGQGRDGRGIEQARGRCWDWSGAEIPP